MAFKRNEYVDGRIKQLLIDQARKEKENARLYEYIGHLLSTNAYVNMGKVFYNHYEEEMHHSDIVMAFLSDMNVEGVRIQALYEVGPETTNPDVDFFDENGKVDLLKIAEFVVIREEGSNEAITTLIRETRKSTDPNTCIVEPFLMKFGYMQRDEINNANDFLDIIEDTERCCWRLLDVHFDEYWAAKQTKNATLDSILNGTLGG